MSREDGFFDNDDDRSDYAEENYYYDQHFATDEHYESRPTLTRIKMDTNMRRRFVTEIRSEGFADIKELELFDKWRQSALQSARLLGPVIKELQHEMIMFNSNIAIPFCVSTELFYQVYFEKLKFVKAKTVNHTYHVYHETLYPPIKDICYFPVNRELSCPVLSMREFTTEKLFTIVDIQRILYYCDDDYDNDSESEYDEVVSTDNPTTYGEGLPCTDAYTDASNLQVITPETYLPESTFISRNPLSDKSLDEEEAAVVRIQLEPITSGEVLPCTEAYTDAHNLQVLTPETYLPESTFISRNPLSGNTVVDDDDASYDSLSYCCGYGSDLEYADGADVDCLFGNDLDSEYGEDLDYYDEAGEF